MTSCLFSLSLLETIIIYFGKLFLKIFVLTCDYQLKGLLAKENEHEADFGFGGRSGDSLGETL